MVRTIRIGRWVGLAVCVVIAGCMVGNGYWSLWWRVTARLEMVIANGRIEVTLYETSSVHPGVSLSPLRTQMDSRAYNRWLILQMAESLAFHVQRSSRSISIVALLVVAAVATSVLVGVDAWLVARRRRGCCARCGYDLRGLASGVCPECGAAREQLAAASMRRGLWSGVRGRQ